MKQNTIDTLPRLRNENYEHIFNVYSDKDNMYYYNMLQTIAIPSDLPPGYYQNYNVVYGDTWPLISYKLYRSPNLWWVILSVNNIINPTQQPEPGTIIKALRSRAVNMIISQISSQSA